MRGERAAKTSTIIFGAFLLLFEGMLRMPIEKFFGGLLVNVLDVTLYFFVPATFGFSRILLGNLSRVTAFFIGLTVGITLFVVIHEVFSLSGSFDTIFKTLAIFRPIPIILLFAKELTRFDKTPALFHFVLIFLVLINFAAVLFQVLLPSTAFAILQPGQLEGGLGRVASNEELWDGTCWGLFNSQINLAYFSLGSVLCMRRNNLISAICLVMCIMSGSLVVSVMAVICFLLMRKAYFMLLLGIVLGSLSLISIYEFFFPGIDFSDFFDVLLETRLGLVYYTAPQFFSSGISVTSILFGIGADKELLGTILFNQEVVPLVLRVAMDVETLEDVFWVALLYYYGVFGLVTVLFTFVAALRFLVKGPSRYLLLSVIVLGGFVNQIFSFIVFFVIIAVMSRDLNGSNTNRSREGEASI
ncbi:hypothetical protein N9334_00700 [Luminiphilus sp.]|nr:hypothetical protein [Luminiphilus sp.]